MSLLIWVKVDEQKKIQDKFNLCVNAELIKRAHAPIKSNEPFLQETHAISFAVILPFIFEVDLQNIWYDVPQQKKMLTILNRLEQAWPKKHSYEATCQKLIQ